MRQWNLPVQLAKARSHVCGSTSLVRSPTSGPANTCPIWHLPSRQSCRAPRSSSRSAIMPTCPAHTAAHPPHAIKCFCASRTTWRLGFGKPPQVAHHLFATPLSGVCKYFNADLSLKPTRSSIARKRIGLMVAWTDIKQRLDILARGHGCNQMKRLKDNADFNVADARQLGFGESCQINVFQIDTAAFLKNVL